MSRPPGSNPPSRAAGARARAPRQKPDVSRALARADRNAAPRRRLPRWLPWGAGGAAVLLGGFAFWFLILYPSGHGPGDGKAVELTVEGDETAGVLADKLAEAGLVASPRLFAWYLSMSGGAASVVKGLHLLTDDASPRELVDRLERKGSAARVKVTFPEGWNRFTMARRLQEKHVCILRGFLNATADKELMKELRVDAENLEGYLFPATYELAPDSDPADVVRTMKAEFDRRYVALSQKNESGLLDLSMSLKFGPKEIVTLASMIEKEAVVDEERPIIASVFLNRLRDPAFAPKYLQCDPTAGYGCVAEPERAASCVGYTGKITPAVNNDPANRYSTYKHEGLPPGPISNPGQKSLEAVMAPRTTRYLYFVATGDHRHTFSDTYGSHTAAIKDGGRH